MNTEDLGNSKILNLLFKPAGMLMGSWARRWLMNPMKTLRGAGIQPGQTVLEVGCGTGFFTIYWQKTPDEVNEEVRNAIDARHEIWPMTVNPD